MTQHPPRLSFLVRRLAGVLLGIACGLPALAQVVSAPEGPRVGQAGNGVPVVDINAPNARGVSHNRYRDFNVGREGLILNNQTSTGNSALGGHLLRNDRLQGRAAGLIVNEVTGTAPSQLRGYIEVAGQRAGVVVANPNGISCQGCGFINAPRATLSTGVPQWGSDGSLLGYRVGGGAITVDGQGLDASGSDRLSLIARCRSTRASGQARSTPAAVWASSMKRVCHSRRCRVRARRRRWASMSRHWAECMPAASVSSAASRAWVWPVPVS